MSMLSPEKKKSYFQNLFLVANADGHFAEEEKVFLQEIARKLGLDQRESEKIINSPEELDFIIPDTVEQKQKQLEDIIVLMMADGKIHKKEHELCLMFTEKIGFTKEELDQVVKKVLIFNPAQLNIRTYQDVFTDLAKLKLNNEEVIDLIITLINRKILSIPDRSKEEQNTLYKFIWLFLVRQPILKAQNKKQLLGYLSLTKEGVNPFSILKKDMLKKEEVYGQSLIKMESMTLSDLKLDIMDALENF